MRIFPLILQKRFRVVRNTSSINITGKNSTFGIRGGGTGLYEPTGGIPSWEKHKNIAYLKYTATWKEKKTLTTRGESNPNSLLCHRVGTLSKSYNSQAFPNIFFMFSLHYGCERRIPKEDEKRLWVVLHFINFQAWKMIWFIPRLSRLTKTCRDPEWKCINLDDNYSLLATEKYI